MQPDQSRPLASIVVPAHNEATLIGATLNRLVADDGTLPWEVVVVCNGCTDETADVARLFAGVRVVETSTAGKMAALNLGDDNATVFPRIYLDADAVVGVPALRELVEALTREPGRSRVGSPRLLVDSSRSGALVQAYFSVWSQLRYANEAIGSGVYGMNRIARERFERFPDRGGDDQLVYRLYDASERVITTPGFTYVAPRTLRSLIRSRTRMFALNLELERTVSLPPPPPAVGWRAQGLTKVLRRGPIWGLRVGLFVAIQVVVRVRARRAAKAGTIDWHQDRTTRGG